MDDSERERWRRGLQAAEAEEMATLEPAHDAERDRLLADAVLTRFQGQQRPRTIYKRRSFWAVATAATMAALVFWFLPRVLTPEPLPNFKLHLRGDTTMMGDEPPSPQAQLSADSLLSVVLQPAHQVRGKLMVTTYVRSGSGPLIRWPISFEQQPSGALSLSKRLAELPALAAGAWDVVFVVSSPQTIPNEADVVRELSAPISDRSKSWQLVRGQLLVSR